MRHGLGRFAAVLKMVQNAFYDGRVFDAGVHFDAATTVVAGLDIDFEY